MSAPTHIEVPQLLTITEAAKRLSFSRRTLERKIQRGEFPRPFKVGTSTRVPLGDVQAFIEALYRQRKAS